VRQPSIPQPSSVYVNVQPLRWVTGTPQRPSYCRTKIDRLVVNWRLFPGSKTLQNFRDFRLAMAAQLYEAMERVRDIELCDLNTFSTQIDHELEFFGYVGSLVVLVKGGWLPSTTYRGTY
jgi:hypothetical protein